MPGGVPDPVSASVAEVEGQNMRTEMPESESLRAGLVLLDRYVLLSHLGHGLGGQTWKAAPLGGGEPVAVKVLPPRADWRSQRDVLNEAAFLRELDHPNVVRYLGMVDLPGGGHTFLVTEFVEGGDLWHWAYEHGPCDPELAAALLVQIAEGLRAVHDRGILHRDLKPANVRVRPSVGTVPRVLVADLGISRRTVLNVASVTRVAGTPGYAAPEAWAGGTVSGASDVYALGAIAWFLLSGVEPEPSLGSTCLDPVKLPDLIGPERRKAAEPLVALVGEMLALEPPARPSVEACCRRLAQLAGAHVVVPTGLSTGVPSTRPLPTPPRGGHPSLAREVPSPTASPVPSLTPPVPAAAWPERSRGGDGRREPSPSETFLVDDEPPPPQLASRWRAGAFAAVVAAAAVLVCAGVTSRLASGPVPVVAPPIGVGEPAVDARPAPAVPPPSAPPPAAPGPAATPAVATPAVVAPAPAVAAPVPAAAPAAPSPVSIAPAAISSGPVGRLRVGITAPNGLPADVSLVVSAPGGVSNRSMSTQVVLTDARSGPVRVSLESAMTTLGEASVEVPPGADVRVLCKALAADFSAMRNEVLP
jgi:serine/threonine-protein kinase